MSPTKDFLSDFHWLMDVLNNIDVGLVILDREYNIQLWNSFMQNHSARTPSEILGANIFAVFPELPPGWFKRKVESVLVLRNSAFTTWEQRPYLFRFRNYRPITGVAEFMYQNSTIIPLKDTKGRVEHICLIIYDVTETAVNRLQLETANTKLHQLSRTDGLTGLLNRKTWEEEMHKEFRRYHRHRQQSCSLVMFDIDHFKNINDRYGHPAGDDVIRETAAIVKASIRDIDIAGRYGGEEFALILVNTAADGALLVAERLRKHIENKLVRHEEQIINYTISLGVCELSPAITEPVNWIEAADKALYQAKHGGRNNSVIYKPGGI